MAAAVLFAYGSLVHPVSMAATLGSAPQPLGPARLRGWRRRWSAARDNLASEKTFAVDPDGRLPRWVLGLNVEPAQPDEEGPNGFLYELSEEQLARLDLRELRYRRVDVGDAIEAAPERGPLVTYAARPEHHAPSPPAGAVILARYLEAVEDAFAARGEEQLEAFRRTTGPSPAPVVRARLVRDRIPAGNPRTW